MTPTRRRRAFTMVEAVIASALLAGLLVLFQGSMASSAQQLEKGRAGIEATLTAQRVLELLRRDLRGPYPWYQCNFPVRAPLYVLRDMGYTRDRDSFSKEERRIDRWFTYYREGEGPVAPHTKRWTAVPHRVRDPLAPCYLRWGKPDEGNIRWIDGGPPQRELQPLKAAVPFVEATPHLRIWEIGPAFWHHDVERQTLVRWTLEGGWTELAVGLAEDFMITAIEEYSVNEVRKPKHAWIPVLSKQMLEVTMRLSRDEGRQPLAVRTYLARHE